MRRNVIPARPDLEKTQADLVAQIETAQADLRRALIEAGDTVTARAQLRDLEQRAAAVARELADLDAAAEQEAQHCLQQTANAMATAASRRLSDRLAALQPPVQPLGTR
ncbi:hypothetical protein [Azospirillum brasilense]|uniref:hypothetical protein n=1 Tax=Azospirillum brasilense TaxID=192 RepID=UPI001ED9F7EC|nr:hypothetical protein [Azospirillum brasilense]UKJ74245.1 hypothetical protein H1Q64_06580 [Azospirillum brasilense]